MDVNENTHERKVVVIAGPVGVGKNSVISGLLKQIPNAVDLITATTRPPRPGEVDGVDYFFLTSEQFDALMRSGDIPEVQYHPAGHRYGTMLPFLRDHIAQGHIIIGDLNIIGARYLKEQFNALTIFIMPPSFQVLESRIKGRNAGMGDDELEKRLAMARHELEDEALWYDYRVVNEEGKLDETVVAVMEILKKEGYNLGVHA